MMTMIRTLPLLLAALSLPAGAQSIFRCTDASGATVIANSKLDKSCKPVNLPPDSTLPAPKARPGGSASTPTPATFPRVGEDTQKARDTDRKRILEQELSVEQRSLELARRELQDQENARVGEERLQPYRERVGQHERNLQAIQRELAGQR
jgi:hypothetical protein